MGSWGAGIFDNDTSLDYLGNLIERVKFDIKQDLDAIHDGVLERPIGAQVSILRVVAEAYGEVTSVADSIEVLDWKRAYEGWLREVVSRESDDRHYWEAFAKSLLNEFDSLLRVAVRHGDRGTP